uniref:Uncharacterized protein n=1 Tax=Myoviridae sp. ct2th6 TaxID=2826606 RepID=A0A8S5NP26_9CAUD|nr:MAG TPA: hypothetical protein [Myoviridae sp. ct2th6]DAG77556.1 MAG TPA: hypothetical protein [Caudoviricetes sp.]
MHSLCLHLQVTGFQIRQKSVKNFQKIELEFARNRVIRRMMKNQIC